jgi:hypothetical protein
MKTIKIMMMALMVCLTNMSFGQNFPGEDVELLVGKELRVIEKSQGLQKYGYKGFFIDSTYIDRFGTTDTKKIYSCCDSDYYSKYTSLVDKKFTVLSYQQYTYLRIYSRFKLLLNNPDIGNLYFDYNPDSDYDFPFEVIGGLTPPENFYCKKIEESNDKFTNETTYKVGKEKNGLRIEFLKVVKMTTKTYYMSIDVTGSTLNVGEKGVTILLNNGKKIDKPLEKIDVNYSDGYVYSAFIRLTPNDILLIKNNLITDVRLYIYDRNLSIEMSKELQEYLKCLTK